MPTLRMLALGLLLGSVGCDGPTLVVGEFLDSPEPEVDAGASQDGGETDAETEPERDASARDAWLGGDGGGGVIYCNDLTDPCRDPRLPICIRLSPFGGVCAECFGDRGCEPGQRCDDSLQCKRDDGWHDPNQK